MKKMTAAMKAIVSVLAAAALAAPAAMMTAAAAPLTETAAESTFDWSSVPVEKSWTPLYRAESGREISAWGCDLMMHPNWKNFLNEKFELVLVYESEAQPYLVLQGGWYEVHSDSAYNDSFDNMIFFDYEDVAAVMTDNRARLYDMYNFYVSADSEDMTAYALYAVPAGTAQEMAAAVPAAHAEEPETEAPTEPQRDPMDCDGDGAVTVTDAIIMQRYVTGAFLPASSSFRIVDVNGDGMINVLDYMAIRKAVLSK